MSHLTDNNDSSADSRIDSMATAFGRELRRPAPADGVASARRTHKRKQAVRAAVGGTAVAALMAIGAIAVFGGDDGDTTVVPADPTNPTSPNPTDPSPTNPPETIPPTTVDPGVGVGAPQWVYTITGDPFDPQAVLTLVDPVTGEVLRTEPIDVDASMDAQNDLPRPRSSGVIGDIEYEFVQVVYDGGTLNLDAYPNVDLCGQNVLTVTSPNGSALPERALAVSISPDNRWVVVLSAECPEEGTMGADAVGTQQPFTATLQVFDAQNPDQPGLTLMTDVAPFNIGTLSFSGNGRFVALESYDAEQQYFVFDVTSGERIDFGQGCTLDGTNYSRFIGPFVGESSIAVMLDCDGEQQFLVRDLMPGGEELVVPTSSSTPGIAVRAEIDYEHFESPSTAWFILCDLSAETCSVGQGDGDLVELAGVSDASFLPLGFYPGG